MVAAIAQWIRLCIPFCSPRFKSQAQHLHFIRFTFEFWCEKDESKQKEAKISPELPKKDTAFTNLNWKSYNFLIGAQSRFYGGLIRFHGYFFLLKCFITVQK